MRRRPRVEGPPQQGIACENTHPEPGRPAPSEPRKPDVTVYGVDPEAAARALRSFLSNEHGEPRPWCTCLSIRGWVFDPQIGVYLHSDANCWKPSKAYYTAAVHAGILKAPTE